MIPYWSDERGRYGTGESYDWFQKYPDGVENFESEDELWTYTDVAGGVEMCYAFNCCYSLKDINFPTGVKDVSWALQFVDIKCIEFPQGVENAASVMSGTESVESVFIPKSVNCLYEAFADCENLKKVVLEEGLRSIEEWAFFNCVNMRELTIPESVVTIEQKSVGIMEIREYTDSEKTAYRIRGEQVVPGFVIKGVSGSVAEEYALENRIQFVALN